MSISKCRVCNHAFFEKPLLRYVNMPRAAQFLPDAASLTSDKGIELEIYQCSGCGLVQLSNDPVPYYKEVIRASAFSEEMKNFRMKQFGAFAENFGLKGKKVIEIGCGRGEYLSIIQQSGMDAYGLEHSEASVMESVGMGLKVSQGFVQNSRDTLPHAPFDAFVILNYLEHLPDPNSTLSGIYNNLTDGAIGLVEVPNFNMILRKKLFSEFACDHLLYFTKETLIQTLNLNGFEAIQCNAIWYDYIISAIVQKREKIDISIFYNYQKQLKDQIETYIRRFKHKRVAVWGAGHQALAVISLADLAEKIRYVVDSAEFKQNRYTPATHVPIRSPETLDTDPVDAVIVMAAGYSDEVAGIIRKRYDKSMQIAILRDYGLEEI